MLTACLVGTHIHGVDSAAEAALPHPVERSVNTSPAHGVSGNPTRAVGELIELSHCDFDLCNEDIVNVSFDSEQVNV